MTSINTLISRLSQPAVILNADTLAVLFANVAYQEVSANERAQSENPKSLLSDIHVEDRETVSNALRENNNVTLSFRLLQEQSEPRWFRASISRVQENQQSMLCLTMCNEALCQYSTFFINDKLAELLNHSPTVIYRCEPTENYLPTYCSPNIYNLLGRNSQDCLSEPDFWSSNIHPEDMQRVFGGYRQKLEEKGYHSHEYRFKHADGSYRWIKDSAVLTHDLYGKPRDLVGNWIDITEQKQLEIEKQKLEDEVFQTQKMKAVGTLAGGIAHEFNNMLAVILGYGELLEQRLKKESVESNYLLNMQNAATRSKHLVEQLLAFSRKNMKQFQLHDLYSLLKDELDLFQSSLDIAVQIHLESSAQSYLVFADINDLRQILFSILHNAVEAIDENGRINILLENAHKNNSNTGFVPLTKGDFIHIQVKDEGKGILPEILPRVFEPFFTTKEVGEGAGMGLAVAYSLINNYGGSIAINSEVGEGTKVDLYLSNAGLVLDQLHANKVQRENDSRKRVLLVDDEALFADMAGEILNILEYDVVKTNSACEALAIFKRDITHFDLLITDQCMPEMLGTNLIRQIKKLNPNLPVVLVKGYATELNADVLKAYGVYRVLNKPFSIREIQISLEDLFA